MAMTEPVTFAMNMDQLSNSCLVCRATINSSLVGMTQICVRLPSA
ncbi:hypothetical protein DSM3645_04950 [Blastopirellula marina DSM 3645]|uniref:Uncharacterized protein n=1 Tax=Blastopirellula marina DSM 3645 TaxID=314230 RepID=A4A2M3_9BACT|nr:hypothetical protein DSM3645_04950 [Blastopirellula marina DSM 3645]